MKRPGVKFSICFTEVVVVVVVLSRVDTDARPPQWIFYNAVTWLQSSHADLHPEVYRGGTRGAQCPGCRKVPLISEVLFARQYIYLSFEHRNTSASNMGRQTCFLPRAPSNLGTRLPAPFTINLCTACTYLSTPKVHPIVVHFSSVKHFSQRFRQQSTLLASLER